MEIPDILTFTNGTMVDKNSFPARREEMLSLLLEHIYGTFDYEQKSPTAFKEVETVNISPTLLQRRIEGDVDGFKFSFYVFEPARQQHKLPVILYIRLKGQLSNPTFLKLFSDDFSTQQTSLLPVPYLIESGFAVGILDSEEISSDDSDAKQTGVYKAFLGEQSDCGQIHTWAWGLSRAADYFFNLSQKYDVEKIGVSGHSRGGKTALLASALDERFAFTHSNNSGCSGAALHRNSTGESIEYINRYRPHWFNAKYKTYAHKDDSIPVDQHMLLACTAPRLVYVSSAKDDPHASPQNEFLSCVHATPAYEVLGLKGFIGDKEPQIRVPYHQGNIGYHIRSGKHAFLFEDWRFLIDFLKSKGIYR